VKDVTLHYRKTCAIMKTLHSIECRASFKEARTVKVYTN
jgi:hypothetical protein